jgi:ER lumen protein retaining receptor
MNYFRLFADLSHFLSMLLLIRNVWKTGKCTGVSLRTQELYLLVFVTRYVDLFWNWSSYYNVAMKCIYLLATSYTIYLIRFKFVASYREFQALDNVRHLLLIVPCFALALLVNAEFTWFEISWSFSLYLEAVAILPQCVVNRRRQGLVSVIAKDYMFCLGAYRALYLLNWIYRYFAEPDYVQWIVWIAGLIQTSLYIDFFYYYVLSKLLGSDLKLPT